MQQVKGFIVMLNCISGQDPVFREDDKLMFFDLKSEAQEEINDLVRETKAAVKRGDMQEAYSKKDYSVCPAEKRGEYILFKIDGEDYFMKETDESPTKGKLTGILDCTPTWESLLSIMLARYGDGLDTENLVKEFIKMAQAADMYNALIKQPTHIVIEIKKGAITQISGNRDLKVTLADYDCDELVTIAHGVDKVMDDDKLTEYINSLTK